MKNRTVYIFATLIAILATACNKENDFREEGPKQAPVTITARYADTDPGSKVAYTESGASINAQWETGDVLLVVYDGRVSSLTLKSGAGTAYATFTGSISYSATAPSATSVLSCYVQDKNNPAALTVSDNTITYSDAAFLGQNGTVAGAAKCNTYYGTAVYGSGSNIDCLLSVNCSILKFTITDIAAHSGHTATLAYKSGDTTLAEATWTVSAGANTVYLAVPAGTFSGVQKLDYSCTDMFAAWSMTLSADRANFKAGQTYSKRFAFLPTFSVAADKRVRFSRGNLQYQATTGTWRFAENQWNFVGNDSLYGNVRVGDVKSNNESIASDYSGWIDLFGWGTWTNDGTRPSMFPYNSLENNGTSYYKFLSSDFKGSSYRNSLDRADDRCYDWRTLSCEEWTYLLQTRAGVTVNGSTDARYTLAYVNNDVLDKTNVSGILVFPDNYAGPTESTSDITWGTINAATSSFSTRCTQAGWAELEAAGCIFLPSVGYRVGSGESSYTGGAGGGYWASTSTDVYDQVADHLYFHTGGTPEVNPGAVSNRYTGYAVRLVYDVD